MGWRKTLHGLAIAMIAGTALAQPAQRWKPSRNVEVIVQSAAGGSSDRSARVTQKILSSLPGFPSVSVNNKPGAGGLAVDVIAAHLAIGAQRPGQGTVAYGRGADLVDLRCQLRRLVQDRGIDAVDVSCIAGHLQGVAGLGQGKHPHATGRVRPLAQKHAAVVGSTG